MRGKKNERESMCVWGGGQGKEYFNEELGIPK